MGKWMAVAGALTLVAFLLGTSYAVAFPPDEEAEMQQAVEQYAAALEYPGIVAGVWQQGQGSYVASTGVADTATTVPRAPMITPGSEATRRR